ncbi:MAG: hypothetical protein HYV90_05975 [Candidatus Woesebacteria bacterium]|nr:MAG: hypothetical protein HYV90_05975 [Candidatus Woesebacteria bacterium]
MATFYVRRIGRLTKRFILVDYLRQAGRLLKSFDWHAEVAETGHTLSIPGHDGSYLVAIKDDNNQLIAVIEVGDPYKVVLFDTLSLFGIETVLKPFDFDRPIYIEIQD